MNALVLILAGLVAQCGDPSCVMCYGSYYRHSTPVERTYYHHTPTYTSDVTTHYQAADEHPWPFRKARAKAAKEGCPLLVFVTASWCGSCQEIKRKYLPVIQREGGFRDIGFAVVDYDIENKLALEVLKGKENVTFPWWARYERVDGKLYRLSAPYTPKSLKQTKDFLAKFNVRYARQERKKKEKK